MSGSDRADRRIAETMDIIASKWHPGIVARLLEEGPLRFNELQERLDGISGKVLTDSLADLTDDGVVERRVVSESSKRVEYDLTPHGRDLQSVIEALAEWGERHLDESSRPTVLIVDDDPRLVRMHADWLGERYAVETAYSGEGALRALDDDVDVLVLDRRMPGLSGEAVLRTVRDLGVDCRVVVLTAVEPDFDVAAMPFDAYVVKPGVKDELQSVVADVLDRAAHDEPVLELLSLRARRALLEAEKTDAELADSETYADLVDRIDELAAEIDDPATRAVDSPAVQAILDR